MVAARNRLQGSYLWDMEPQVPQRARQEWWKLRHTLQADVLSKVSSVCRQDVQPTKWEQTENSQCHATKRAQQTRKPQKDVYGTRCRHVPCMKCLADSSDKSVLNDCLFCMFVCGFTSGFVDQSKSQVALRLFGSGHVRCSVAGSFADFRKDLQSSRI